jgi:hypothetical protein
LYRQVLTPVDNLQRLLRPPIFDKTRLVFYKKVRQRNYTNWFLPDREDENAQDLDSLCAVIKMIITKLWLQTDDAKHRCLTPLSESTSLSQVLLHVYPYFKSRQCFAIVSKLVFPPKFKFIISSDYKIRPLLSVKQGVTLASQHSA